jgi:hypothetical protein
MMGAFMNWPGEKLMMRLLETIEKSGTGLFRPWQLKRVGKAEAEVASHRMTLIAAVEKQIAVLRASNPSDVPLLSLPSGGASDETNVRIEPTFDVISITRNATASQTIEYMRKEVNIEKAISHAESTLQQDTAEPSNQAMDMDWFFRWREYAGGMSSDTFQQLWGNVLAGELKTPGLFTYRTLDFLRNLSQDEAKLIERLASTMVDCFKVIHGKRWEKFGAAEAIANHLSHYELELLEELGVLNGVSTMGYIDQAEPHHMEDGRHIHILECNGRGIMATTDDPKKQTGLGFYRATKLGMNVLKLVQSVPDEAYLVSLGQVLVRDGFKVEIGDVISNDDGTRSFTNHVAVTSPPHSVSEVEVGSTASI